MSTPNPVADVFAFLTAQGIAGGTTSWLLLRRRVVDEKSNAVDQMVVLTEDGGSFPEIPTTQGIGDAALSDAGVHVLVRAGAWDSDAAYAKSSEIQDALHGLLNAQLGDRTYLRVRALTAVPIFIGFDDQGRPRYTQAYRLLAELV